MAEALFELVAELLLQVLAELAAELGWESVTHSLRPGRKANPVLAGVGIAMLGSALGLASAFLLPHRLWPSPRVPGVSLVLAPLGAGLVMHLFGRWRRGRGGDPSHLATFWGGALFAFCLALVRRLLLDGA